MNCSQASSLLSLYLDDELDDLSRKRVYFHVQKCPACSHDLATLAKTVRVLRFAADREPENDSPCFTHPGTDKISLMNVIGSELVYDPEKCYGCGLCATSCPAGIITLSTR